MWKKILVTIVGVAIGIALIGLALPDEFRVERSVVVQADPATIFPYLNSPRRWPEWSAWNVEKYPRMTVTYSGPDEGVGAKSSWIDPDNGNGNLVITSSDPAWGVAYDLQLERFSASEGALAMEPVAGGTKVSMRLRGGLGRNPFVRWFGLAMDGMMGAEFEEGLAKLERVVEAKASESAPGPRPG